MEVPNVDRNADSNGDLVRATAACWNSASDDAGRADGLCHCLRRIVFYGGGLADDKPLVGLIHQTL